MRVREVEKKQREGLSKGKEREQKGRLGQQWSVCEAEGKT